jgi:hypothetical protein
MDSASSPPACTRSPPAAPRISVQGEILRSRPYPGMRIVIEPQHGHDLDRLVTALLNATGVVHRAIEDTDHPADADGVQIIGLVAGRLRGSLTVLAELRSDEQLAQATQVLAEATLLIAGELGLEGNFRP